MDHPVAPHTFDPDDWPEPHMEPQSGARGLHHVPGLAAEGFRFVEYRGLFGWVHPAGVAPAGSVDCTDMDDETFAAYVAAAEGRTA